MIDTDLNHSIFFYMISKLRVTISRRLKTNKKLNQPLISPQLWHLGVFLHFSWTFFKIPFLYNDDIPGRCKAMMKFFFSSSANSILLQFFDKN